MIQLSETNQKFLPYLFTKKVLFLVALSFFGFLSCDDEDDDDITLTADFTASIDDLTVTFTNTSENATESIWNFGDGTTPVTDENPVHTYAEAGTYEVTLTTLFGDLATEKKTMEIEVGLGGITPVPDFTFVVAGSEVTFTDASTGASSYAWDFGDDAGSSTEQNPVYTYAQPGDYEVTLTATSDEDISVDVTKTVTIVETVTPVPDFTFVVAGSEVTFTNTSTNAATYAWDFGDNAGTSTEENPVYEYADAGDYEVTLTATSTDNVSVDITKTITIVEEVTATFAAEIINGSMNDETKEVNGEIETGDNVDPWNVNPNSTLDDGSASPYDEWSNGDLDAWLEANTGDRNQQAGSSSTSYNTPRSIKFETVGRRAYQPITVEIGVTYTINAGVLTEGTGSAIGAVAGTFYILDKPIANEVMDDPNDATSLGQSIVSSEEVTVVNGVGQWDDVSFQFTATTEEVILYFIPEGIINDEKEVFLDDISIETPGF